MGLLIMTFTRVGKVLSDWCRRGDSNPHELPHTPLKRARLPIPPLRLLQFYQTIVKQLFARRRGRRCVCSRAARRRGSRLSGRSRSRRGRAGIRTFLSRTCSGRYAGRGLRRRRRLRLIFANRLQHGTLAGDGGQRKRQSHEHEHGSRADGNFREQRLCAARPESCA